MRRLPILFAALLLAAATLSAHADTLTTNFGVNFTGLTGPQENLFGITEFDPRLGTLNSITATLTGYVDFVPQNPGDSFQLTLSGPYGDIFRQNYTASSTISLYSNFTNVAGYINCCVQAVNHLILDPDVSVTGGSASTVVSASNNAPANLSGTFTFNYTPAAVTPEPSSVVLLGSGLLTLAAAARKRLLNRT